MKNLNITSGSRSIWMTSNGREIPVDQLAIPHLKNILTDLVDKAMDAGNISNIHINNYLYEHCPTFIQLRNKGMAKQICNNYGIPLDYKAKSQREAGKKEKITKIKDKKYLEEGQELFVFAGDRKFRLVEVK